MTNSIRAILIVVLIILCYPFFGSTVQAQSSVTPHIYLPYFSTAFDSRTASVFWFGKVNTSDNYIDVRAGYTNTELTIQTSVFDQQMWYDETSSSADLTNWDGASIYLQTGQAMYKFDAQVSHWQPRTNYQNAYVFQNGNWVVSSAVFTTTSGWRGESPNNNTSEERGWVVTFTIPFASIGGTQSKDMQVGIVAYDKDNGTEVSRKTYWPTSFVETDSSTWGKFTLGLPSKNEVPTINDQTVVIRHKLQNAVVTDAMVGGNTVCGSGSDFWTQWGDLNYSGSTVLNIQNQSDVADWPCFSKAYVNFPLDQVPKNKVIKNATLKLYLFGNAGGGQFDPAQRSFIQVLRTNTPWSEQTITWNNAPYPIENISGTWVDPVSVFPGWPGVKYEWDVTKAVADAYIEGNSADLILYSADSDYHSGKYFVSSDTGDWNEVGRPTLTIVYGDLVVTPTSVSSCKLQGDLNCSGKVDLNDLAVLLSKFGMNDTVADVTGDGKVTLSDLSILLSNFGS